MWLEAIVDPPEPSVRKPWLNRGVLSWQLEESSRRPREPRSPHRESTPVRPGRLLQEVQILFDEVATDALGISIDQLPGERSRRLAVGDRSAIESLDRQNAEAGGGEEHLLGVGRVEQVDVARRAGDAELSGHIHGHMSAHTRQNITLGRREKLPVAHDEDVAAQALGE